MRPLFYAFLTLSLACSAWADVVRIAVVSDPPSKDLAALVTTELFSNPSVALLERDELAKIGDVAAKGSGHLSRVGGERFRI